MITLYVLPITLAVLLLIDMLYSTGTLCPLYGLFQCISTAVLFNTVTLELVMYPIIVQIINNVHIHVHIPGEGSGSGLYPTRVSLTIIVIIIMLVEAIYRICYL